MNNYKLYFLFISIFLLVFYLYFYYQYIIRTNLIVFFIVNRGILAPNCNWWMISDLFLKDGSGIHLYYDILQKYNNKIIPINMLGNKIYLVTDIQFIKIILQKSPDTFGAGKLKSKMFQSFMHQNVGISHGLEWINRRNLNERVLDTDHIHQYALHFDLIIKNNLSKLIPTDYREFNIQAQKITTEIVFGTKNINPDIFKIFSEANSLIALINNQNPISPSIKKSYHNYLIQHLENPIQKSLIELSKKYSNNNQELIQQIPHWIFPIVGLINTSFPRLLLVLNNSPNVFKKVMSEINQFDSQLPTMYNFQRLNYLRKCILELLRLNNPVVTTFRTLMRDFQFNSKYKFKKNDQFLILNNPILRSPDYFKNPNQFNPDRWTDEMENSYYSISFNQGPQKCPGKDLAIFILQSMTVNYLKILNTNQLSIQSQKINTSNFPQMINPCKIKFYLTN